MHPYEKRAHRAIGLETAVEIEVLRELAAGDRVLICSDGVTAMIDDDAIRSVLTTESGPGQAAEVDCRRQRCRRCRQHHRGRRGHGLTARTEALMVALSAVITAAGTASSPPPPPGPSPSTRSPPVRSTSALSGACSSPFAGEGTAAVDSYCRSCPDDRSGFDRSVPHRSRSGSCSGGALVLAAVIGIAAMRLLHPRGEGAAPLPLPVPCRRRWGCSRSPAPLGPAARGGNGQRIAAVGAAQRLMSGYCRSSRVRRPRSSHRRVSRPLPGRPAACSRRDASLCRTHSASLGLANCCRSSWRSPLRSWFSSTSDLGALATALPRVRDAPLYVATARAAYRRRGPSRRSVPSAATWFLAYRGFEGRGVAAPVPGLRHRRVSNGRAYSH